MQVVAILGIVVSVLVGLVALVVLIPFRVRANGALHGDVFSGTAQLDWAWGLVAVRIAPGKGAVLRVAGVPTVRLRAVSSARRAERRKDGVLGRAVGTMRHRGVLLDVLRRLIRTLRLRITLTGLVGTGDPADNALLLVVLRGLEDVPGVSIALDVDWIDEALELDIEGSARIWIVHLLGVAASLLARRQTRVALRAVA